MANERRTVLLRTVTHTSSVGSEGLDEADDWENFLHFRKEGWPETWSVVLSGNLKTFSDFCVGFFCNPTKSSRPTPEQEEELAQVLKEALRTIGREVKEKEKGKGFPAFTYLREPYRNWNDETFLLLAVERADKIDQFAAWL